jgi:hypothetical protein
MCQHPAEWPFFGKQGGTAELSVLADLTEKIRRDIFVFQRKILQKKTEKSPSNCQEKERRKKS